MQHQWFAIVSKPHREAKAANELKNNRAIETFYPKAKVRVILKTRSGTRITWVEKSYYDGYLFARFSLDQLPKVLGASNVAGIVQFSDMPTPIPDDLMKVIMAGFDDKGLVKHDGGKARFKAMQRVRFTTNSPLGGLLARVVRDGGGETIEVLLNLLGANRTISAPAGTLEAA